MTDKKPRLLLTNDDGINAPGIQAMADILEPEFDLLIVAPNRERSGAGHGITVLRDLRLERFQREEKHWGWSFQGKPADCVKMGITVISKDEPVDLVLSGINLGQNLGINILYSGTVAAAREAVLLGIPAIAFSLAYRDISKASFSAAARVALDLTRKVIRRGLPRDVFLNVNVPSAPYEQIKGYAITRQGSSGFKDKFTEIEDLAGDGSTVYRNVGERFFSSPDEDIAIDDKAVKNKYVSITPLHVDTTAHHHLENLRDLVDPVNE